jgi:hypothetical protein
MSDYIGSEHPYYAKDGKVWKAAIREPGPNGGTKITMGFPVCVMHDAAEGQEAAVAGLMNRGDIADELLEALKAITSAFGAAYKWTTPAMVNPYMAALAAIAKADAIP